MALDDALERCGYEWPGEVPPGWYDKSGWKLVQAGGKPVLCYHGQFVAVYFHDKWRLREPPQFSREFDGSTTTYLRLFDY